MFEYVDKNAVFGVIPPESPLWAPVLGLFAFTGIPTAGEHGMQCRMLSLLTGAVAFMNAAAVGSKGRPGVVLGGPCSSCLSRTAIASCCGDAGPRLMASAKARCHQQ